MPKIIFCLITLLICLPGKIYSQTDIYEFEVGTFDKIKLLDDVDIIYKCLPDSAGMVRYEATPEFEDAFIFKCNNNGTLKIQINSDDVGRPGMPTLYLYSDFLIGIENSSKATIRVEDVIPCVEFKVNQIGNGSIIVDWIKATKISASINTGAGQINLAGECENLSLKMLGAGLISADRLKAKTVNCQIIGAGSIGCWPLETLTVKGIGSTKIYYKGKPVIKKSGGGKLFELPDSSAEDFKEIQPEEDYEDE